MKVTQVAELDGQHLENIFWTYTGKSRPRPESGLDCLICAIFARQRPHRVYHPGPVTNPILPLFYMANWNDTTPVLHGEVEELQHGLIT